MNTKTILAATLFAASALTVQADDYNYLTVACNNSEQSISLSAVQKLTFDASQVIVWTTDGQQITFPLAQMEKMSFTANPTSIQSLAGQSQDLRYEGGQLLVHGSGLVRVYRTDGALVYVAKTVSGDNAIGLDALRSGLYVISFAGQTIKIEK